MRLEELPTPSLVLDLDRLERNCERMTARAAALGVRLRPHMKTAKSVDVGRLATRERSAGITVSTLAELEYFAGAGFGDITYAVGIAGHKVPAIVGLKRRYGARVSLLADSLATLAEVARHAAMMGETLAVFLEVDCGGGRGGVPPEGPELMALGHAVQASPFLSLAGVLTHAGQSYDATTSEAIRQIAEAERAAVALAASRLRAAGIEVPVVSAGSTPTAMHATSMSGVTEMRPGVYTLFDLAQVGLESCTVEDVAVSVLATVIGHNPRAERVLIDAGALALSKDLSGNKRGATVGYGLVCAANGGQPHGRHHVAEVHQEHGLIAGRCRYGELVEAHPMGGRVRILPNHACLTAAPYDRYHVVRGGDTLIRDVWPKVTGWSRARVAG